MTQDLSDYSTALRGRVRKLGDRTVFYKLPISYHKHIKSGSKTGFCDFPSDSNITLELMNKHLSKFVAIYTNLVTIDEILEDLEYHLETYK